MTSTISSRSSLFQEHQTSRESEQWKLTLQDIKALYIQRQYKRCIARSSAILNTARRPIHPVYKTYLYFYSAISYEAMGRYAHNYSINKLPLLHSALDCFVTCLAVLPAIIPVGGNEPQTPSYTSLGDSSFASDLSDTLSPTDSLVSSITDIIDKSLESASDDPFLSDTDGDIEQFVTTEYTIPISHGDMDWQSLMPSPLHVHKPSPPLSFVQGYTHSVDQTAKTTDHTRRAVRVRAPPPLPIKVVPFSTDGRYMSKIKPLGGEESLDLSLEFGSQNIEPNTPPPLTPSHEGACTNYNSSIQFLDSQIHSSIYSIHRLIDEVMEIRKARKTSKSFQRSASFWSFSPVKEGLSQSSSKVYLTERTATQETMEERIARLRAEGWKTVGLKSSKRGWKGAAYYQAYCGSILDELYLNA